MPIQQFLDILRQTISEDYFLRRLYRKILPMTLRSRFPPTSEPIREEPEYLKILEHIAEEVRNRVADTDIKPGLKILYGPSFSFYPPCYIHDQLLSFALRLQGHEIVPIYCNAIQSTECSFYGGIWAKPDFKTCCNKCLKCSESLWQFNPTPALQFSDFIEEEEKREIAERTSRLGPDEWVAYTEDDMHIGGLAKNILVNNYMVGDYHLIPDFHRLGLAHLQNLLMLKMVYERILHKVKPDRVISHDSFYGMNAILEKCCDREGIPFYSHWPGVNSGTWCYAKNGPAMFFDFHQPWKRYSQIALDKRRKKKAQDWLEGRLAGSGTAALGDHQDEKVDFSLLSKEKPTALLASNVIWDMAALSKEIAFETMTDWIMQTIDWFIAHPEYQLLIKPHPVEQNPIVPETVERVDVEIRKRYSVLPDNIILFTPKSRVTVYDLFPLAKVCLVHTTTVGLEMAAAGKQVIATAEAPYRGFGFTLDPSTKSEYFDLLCRVLDGEQLIQNTNQMDLAFKFILFYQYHYQMKTDLMKFEWEEIPRLQLKQMSDLLPGKNGLWDYVIDAIVKGEPILSETRWPPES